MRVVWRSAVCVSTEIFLGMLTVPGVYENRPYGDLKIGLVPACVGPVVIV